MNPSYCPISYSSSSVPTIADTQVVVLNPASRTFTVKSNDLSLAGTYTITVTALSPNGVALTTPTLSFPKLSFLLNLVDPCKTATLTINSTIIQAMTTYILADPEFSFPVLDCHIDCVIVNPKVSALNFVSLIVIATVVQDAMTFTVKLSELEFV